jgi:hypothetical protein
VTVLFQRNGRSVGKSAIFGAVLGVSLFFCGPIAHAELPIEAVIRGAQPAPGADVVALCPDLTERPQVYTVRGEESLATRLARAGKRVFLVDPWSASATASAGFDGAVVDVFPALLKELQLRAEGGAVHWVGHGLCGLLPMAAAARGEEGAASVHWIALGSRLDWSRPSGPLRSWLRAWAEDEEPVPSATQRVLFTGLREAVGPRGSSVPTALKGSTEFPAKNSLELFHRNKLLRPPPQLVLQDVMRWFSEGRMAASTGWLDYTVGLEKMVGNGLVIVGSTDPWAPPESVLPVLHRAGEGFRVETVLVSRSEGAKENYGHLGMLLSQNASADVDRPILHWLNRHQGVR